MSVGLHYVEAGTGPVLVMGHSLGLDHHLYDAAAARLAARYRVIRPDFRGHGDSPKPHAPYTLEEMTDDLVAFVDGLGLDRFAYAGLSMGGMIGMRLALRLPDRVSALVLMDTSASPEPNRVMYETWAGSARSRPPTEQDIAMFLSISVSPSYLRANPPELQALRARMLAGDSEGNYHAQIAVLRRESVLEQLSAIRCPTLIVVGEKDMPTPVPVASEMHARIENSTLVVIPGVGHLSILERPDEVTDAIENLLMGDE